MGLGVDDGQAQVLTIGGHDAAVLEFDLAHEEALPRRSDDTFALLAVARGASGAHRHRPTLFAGGRQIRSGVGLAAATGDGESDEEGGADQAPRARHAPRIVDKPQRKGENESGGRQRRRRRSVGGVEADPVPLRDEQGHRSARSFNLHEVGGVPGGTRGAPRPRAIRRNATSSNWTVALSMAGGARPR